MNQATESTKIAEEYYDSVDADQFYFNVWGGEDIHVGLYQNEGEPIATASRRTVERMATKLDLGPQTRLLDLGAGYGGAARYLADKYGCHVTCLNLSETQNERNRQMTRERGLDSRVDVVHGNFEHLPFDDASFDCAWSQDAFLHSGARQRVIEEVARVLRPGGKIVFTDPMQREGAPRDVLEPILARIHLESLASFEAYREMATKAGLKLVEIEDLTPQLANHYAAVARELEARRDEIEKLASPDYVGRMLQGLANWVSAGHSGHLAWGIVVLEK